MQPKTGYVEKRSKTNWRPVVLHLKYRKGKPLRLDKPNEVSILHRAPYGYEAGWGKATVKVACGLCNAEHTVFKWSLAGGGKRCDICNSKIGYERTSALLDKNTPPEILKIIADPIIVQQDATE